MISFWILPPGKLLDNNHIVYQNADDMERNEWEKNILGLCDLASNDIIKLVLLAFSALPLLKSLLPSGVSHKLQSEGTLPQLSIPYEICSQIARATTFVAARH